MSVAGCSLLLATGFSLIGVSIAAYISWAPAFMMRVHGWSIARVGAVYGGILLVFSTGGILVGGWWVDRLVGQGARMPCSSVAIGRFAACAPVRHRGAVRAHGRNRDVGIASMSFCFGLTQGLPPAAFQAIAATGSARG